MTGQPQTILSCTYDEAVNEYSEGQGR